MSKCISSRWKIGSRAVKKKATHMYSGFIELDMSTVTTVKPLLDGPPIKWPPSIKRTLSQVPKLTSYISRTNSAYSADTSTGADADTKINCIWLISIVNNLY